MKKYNKAFRIDWVELDYKFFQWGKKFAAQFPISDETRVGFGSEREEDDWSLIVTANGAEIGLSFTELLKSISDKYVGEDDEPFDEEEDLYRNYGTFASCTFSKATSENILSEILGVKVAKTVAYYDGVIVLCEEEAAE